MIGIRKDCEVVLTSGDGILTGLDASGKQGQIFTFN